MRIWRRDSSEKPYDFEREEEEELRRLEDLRLEESELQSSQSGKGSAKSELNPSSKSSSVQSVTERSGKNGLTSSEAIVPPVIGSNPSRFFETPWWQVSKPLHGLSKDGYASDIHCDSGTFGTVASIGATLRGLKHQVPNKNSGAAEQNEDWFATVCTTSDIGKKYIISVVCDGLSSARFSSYGAKRTSTLLARDLAVCISGMSDLDSKRLQTEITKSLEKQAATITSWTNDEFGAPQIQAIDIDLLDFGCTVTAAIVSAEADASGNHEIWVGSIGDSPTLKLSKGQWSVVGEKDDDGYGILDTRTSAFPRDTECLLRKESFKKGDCIAVCSDGVANFVYRNGSTLALGNYLSKRWNSPVEILTFINQLSFDLPTADDDRTAVVFWSI
jgi:serine/threonine protein phosphatase PrpC